MPTGRVAQSGINREKYEDGVETLTASGQTASLKVYHTLLAVDATDAFPLPAGLWVGQKKRFTTISATNVPVATVTGTFVGGTTVSGMGAVGRSCEGTWTGAAWSMDLNASVTVA